MQVGYGEFVGVLDPTGAGKTTLLEMIEGLRRPDAGEIRLLGDSPWPRNPALRPRIGVQLQASAFFERLTAREQIHTFAALYDVSAGAVNLANFFVMPMAFLSGSCFPLDSAPAWLQTISRLMPLRHLNDGMLDVMVRDMGPAAAAMPLVILLGFAAVVGLMAVKIFRWECD